MKCSNCGEEMQEGYVHVSFDEWSSFYWSEKEPPSGGFWKLSMTYNPRKKGEEEILRWDAWHTDKKYWLRKGFRCINCKMITFGYADEEGKV